MMRAFAAALARWSWRKTVIVPSAVALLLVLLVLAQRNRSYLRHFEVAPEGDRVWTFDSDQTEIVDVEIADGSFSWPRIAGRPDTAFLSLTVDATLAGRYFDPSVSVRLDGVIARQGFMRGAAGLRYVNVSPIVSANPHEGDIVTVDGTRLGIDDQRATLYLMSNPGLARQRVLVVAPHPDDAEIAAFGVYSQSVYSQSDVWIVTVTAGDSGSLQYGALFPDAEDHYMVQGRLRAWESTTVPFIGGVPISRCFNLGYFDSMLEEMRADPTTPVRSLSSGATEPAVFRVGGPEMGAGGTATWDSLRADFVRLLEAIRPTLVVTPHPLLDAHLDHKCSTFALVEALEMVPDLEGELLLYATHPTAGEGFPVGDRQSLIGLPAVEDLPEFLCERVWSLPLPERVQTLKVLALEACRDLRDPPEPDPPGTMQSARRAMRAAVRHMTSYDVSYYRRAARPNELFFVISFQQAPAAMTGW